jgi:hypothetical protein
MSRTSAICMKRMLPLLMLGSWAVAMAQAPPGEPPAGAADPGLQAALPCVPAGEAAPEGGEQGTTGPSPAPCEEPRAQPAAEAADVADAGPAAAVEEDPGVEASANEEFTPGDEISEDYPVPLPSDI